MDNDPTAFTLHIEGANSGYSADVMGCDLGLRDTMFLQKPYPPPLLAQTVRTCLDVQKN